MNKYPPLLTMLIIGIGSNAVAGDYFDPSLLATDIGNNDKLDLSIFSHPGGGVKGEREVSVYINDFFYKNVTLDFENGISGALEPIFPSGFFDNILASPYRSIKEKELISTADFLSLVPYGMVRFDQAIARVDISIPQAYLGRDAQMKSAPESWNQGVPALLIDYRLSGSKNKYNYGSSQNFYANAFLGFNLMGWRLRTTTNYISYNSKDLYNKGERQGSFNFYNTYLEKDIGYLRSTLRLGELSTRGMILESFNFKGGKIYSNDEMLNDRLRSYTPTVRGIASSQAVVTIKQGGVVILQKNVPPGPFEINDFSLSGYSGDLYVNIKEADGSEHSFIQPFSTLPEMKREGVSGYEISLGHYNNSGATQYYNESPFLYASWSRGYRNGMTLYSETIQSRKYQLLGVGSTLSLGDFGAVSGDTSLSRANKYDKIHSGQSYGLKYSKNKVDTGTTVTLATYRYSTKDFYSFNDFVSKNDSVQYVWDNRLKNRITLSLNQSLDDYGSLSLIASQQNYWTSDYVSRSFSLSHSFGWNDIFFSTSFSLDQKEGDNALRNNNKVFGFYSSIPLSKLIGKNESTYSTLSYNVTKINNQVRNTATLAGKVPGSMAQYRFSSGWANTEQSSNKALSVNWDGDLLDGSLGYTSSGKNRITDYSLSGSAILYPWRLAIGSDSVINGAAVVETEFISGIKVRQGGETSLLGTAIVTSMQPYTENRIDLDTQNIPDDLFISNASKKIVPEKGAVVPVKYNLFKGKQIVFSLKRYDGTPLPFGSVVSLVGSDSEITGIIDDAGRVYLAGIPSKGILHGAWGYNKSCEVSFNLNGKPSNNSNEIIEYEGVCK